MLRRLSSPRLRRRHWCLRKGYLRLQRGCAGRHGWPQRQSIYKKGLLRRWDMWQGHCRRCRCHNRRLRRSRIRRLCRRLHCMQLRRWRRDGKSCLIWCWHGNWDWRLIWWLDGRWHWCLRKAPVAPVMLRWCWSLYRHLCRCQSRLQRGWQRRLDRSADGAQSLSWVRGPGISDLKAADEGIIYQCHELKSQHACGVCSYIKADIVCYVLPTCKQCMSLTQSRHQKCASGLAPVDTRCDVDHGMLAITRYLQLRFGCRSVHRWLQAR